MAEKKWSEIVMEEREKGNVVCILLPDTWGKIPVKEIIKQPADGLLWDLNRDEATALSFMDKEGMTHWVNNFAVAMVIRELKHRLDDCEDRLEEAEQLLTDTRKLLEPYPIIHFSATNSMYAETWDEIGKFLASLRGDGG